MLRQIHLYLHSITALGDVADRFCWHGVHSPLSMVFQFSNTRCVPFEEQNFRLHSRENLDQCESIGATVAISTRIISSPSPLRENACGFSFASIMQGLKVDSESGG
jgi:hypothetical protein